MDKNDRVKRNRYFFMLCVAVLTSNHADFVKFVGAKLLEPSKDKKSRKTATPAEQVKIAEADGTPKSIQLALDPVSFVRVAKKSEWERENVWEVRLKTVRDAAALALKDRKSRIAKKADDLPCLIHDASPCPQTQSDKLIGECLDNQFMYLLYLCESFQVLMTSEKEKTNLWLTALAKVDKEACVQMKGVRNDYASLLVGYLFHKELKGPFEDHPQSRLPPLTDAIATYLTKRNKEPKAGQIPLSPVSDTVEAFMNGMPKIEEGAFAFLSLSGNIFNQQSAPEDLLA